MGKRKGGGMEKELNYIRQVAQYLINNAKQRNPLTPEEQKHIADGLRNVWIVLNKPKLPESDYGHEWSTEEFSRPHRDMRDSRQDDTDLRYTWSPKRRLIVIIVIVLIILVLYAYFSGEQTPLLELFNRGNSSP